MANRRFDVERRKSNKKSDRAPCGRFDILRQSLKRAEQENCILKERAERAEQENRGLRERLERAERAARTLRAEELARERSLPAPRRAAKRPTIPFEDRWKLPKFQHRSNILDGIYKLLVKGAIPLNDPSITNKQIARVLKEHNLLGPPPELKPSRDFRPVGLPQHGPTLERYGRGDRAFRQEFASALKRRAANPKQRHC
jgi:hypothetical protein